MGKHIRRLVTVAALVLAWTPALADKRVALVIGNGAYRNVPTLPSPANDAADVAGVFERLGFSVKRIADAGFEDMRRGLIDFGRQATDADMAVVYFAGHGMEIGGENWLIPVDAELRSDTDAENEAVNLRTVMLQVARATSLGLVILDACRNNPFSARMTRTARTRAVDRGFARVEPTDNVLVAYASKDGTVANDGTGRNSPFTAALLRNLERPGLEVTFMFRNVRDEVMETTNREQQPFVYGSLSRQAIYLKPQSTLAQVTPPPGEAEQVWAVIKDTNSVAVLEDFIRQFGGTVYGSLARARLAELKRDQVAVAPAAPAASPPPPTTPQVPQAPLPLVDSGVVGTWEMFVPNRRGKARWVMTIVDNGTYQFRSSGPGAAAPHEGTLRAIDGVWTMRPTKGGPRDYVDGGSYELRDANTMAVNGRNGPGVWRRIGAGGSR